MQTREKRMSAKRIIENTKNGNIAYDHPMQRKPGQWSMEQKGLLIHSILADYAVPRIYGLLLDENYDDAFSVLDGKQRLTTICEFVEDGFRLNKNLPIIRQRRRAVITDEDGQRHPQFVELEHDVSGKLFSELDERMKEKIYDFNFSVVLLCDCTEEDVESQFYRLNNGSALVNSQKTRIALGDELAKFITEQEEKDLFTSKVRLTSTQRKREAVQSIVLDTLMLIMDYDFENANGTSRYKFAKWFRENHKQSDLEYVADIFDKLDEALPETDKPYTLMDAANVPVFAYQVQIADEAGLSMEEYGRFLQQFFDSCTEGSEYSMLCGKDAKQSKHDNIIARMNIVEKKIRGWRGFNENV